MTLNLDAIKARLEIIVDGDWHANDREVHSTTLGEIGVFWTGHEEAVFIANAPTDIAALVETVEQYQKLYNPVNTANELNRKDADNYKSLINKIKAVCEQSNNSDGAYIKRLIEEMEGAE